MPITDVTSYRECAKRLLSLRAHLRALEMKLNLSPLDARIVALQNCDAHTSSIALTQKLLSLFHEQQLPLELLQQLMDFEDDTAQISVKRLDDTLRLAFITLYQFQVENMLRNLLVALGHSDAPSAFYRIAEAILNAVTIHDIQTKLRTLNVVALLRNSLHSNGIHTSSNRSSMQIDINGVPYNFVYGDRVRCAGWAYIIHALDAGLDVIEEILLSPEIVALPDPVNDRYASIVSSNP